MKRLNKKEILFITLIAIFLVSIISILVYFNFFVGPSITNVDKRDSVRFESKKIFNIEITNNPLKINKETWCLLVEKNLAFDEDNSVWEKASNGYCSIIADDKDYDVYVKDSYNNYDSTKDGFKKDKKKEIVLKTIKTDVDNVYLYIGQSQQLIVDTSNLNDKNISFNSGNNDVAIVDGNGLITGKSNGKTTIIIQNKKEAKKEVNVVVTRLIKEMDPAAKRDYFTCNMLNDEEANLLDDILFDRVNRAGYGTRAGVLAAARFLTLESTYEVPYFYENGRLENYEPYKHVDGEGRYYHRGLYLSPRKTKEITASFVGPVMWGCKLQNYTDWGGVYVTGELYPNGLDCSGFVTWALLNGGFDVGDVGAGIEPNHKDVTDLGEIVYLSDELMASGRVKAGDLIGLDGHAAILIGWDENNYYIAESLNTTKGVVATTVKRSDLVHNSIYRYVVLMDGVYKEQGNYNSYWK